MALLALLFVTGLRGARAQLADAAFGVGDLEIDDSAAGADAEDADGQVMERNNGGGSGGFAVGETWWGLAESGRPTAVLTRESRCFAAAKDVRTSRRAAARHTGRRRPARRRQR